MITMSKGKEDKIKLYEEKRAKELEELADEYLKKKKVGLSEIK